MNIGTQIQTAGLQGVLAVSTVPGVLVSLLITNEGPDQYLQLWDATAPSDTDAELVFSIQIPNGTHSLDTPVNFTRGIYLRAATMVTHTAAELAAATGLGSDCLLTARYFTT